MKQLLACAAVLGWVVATSCAASGVGEEPAAASTAGADLRIDTISSVIAGQHFTLAWVAPGNAHDWVAIAPAGAAPMMVTSWSYTGGATSGTTTFTASVPGSYVLRVFLNDSYTILSESAPFTVFANPDPVTVKTDKDMYGFGQDVVIEWTGLVGNTGTNWISIAMDGDPLTAVVHWAYADFGSFGSVTIAAPVEAGTYVARAFNDNSYVLAAESVQFVVAAVASSTSTNQTLYAPGQDVTVSWTGLLGTAGDWIALAPTGSPLTAATRWVYTGGLSAGTTTFIGGLGADGTYVARTFSNNSYSLVSQSASFRVLALP
jgi:hypothetical protein